MRDNENDGMSEPPGERSDERGAKNAEEWAVGRRDVGVTVILLRDPSRSESLKERRRERVRKSSPLPLPFSNSSPSQDYPRISDVCSFIKTMISYGYIPQLRVLMA